MTPKLATPANLGVFLGLLLGVGLAVACLLDDYGVVESLAWSLGLGVVAGLGTWYSERRRPKVTGRPFVRWAAEVLGLLGALFAVDLVLRVLGASREVALPVLVATLVGLGRWTAFGRRALGLEPRRAPR